MSVLSALNNGSKLRTWAKSDNYDFVAINAAGPQCRSMLSSRPSNGGRYRLNNVSRSLLGRVLGGHGSPFRYRRSFADQECRKASSSEHSRLVLTLELRYFDLLWIYCGLTVASYFQHD